MIKFLIGANIIVVNNEGHILLGLRKNIFGDGTWGLPGGHVELGERLDAAALRELKEETGLAANLDDLMFVRIANQPRSKEHYLQTCFVLTKYEGEPTNREPDKCDELKWFNPNDLPENIFEPHMSLLITYLNNEAGIYIEEDL
jgi:8-oxo-dGTP diphosphatase